MASFAVTCKLDGVDFEQWLADVLPRLDTYPAFRAATLLPHHWKEARENAVPERAK